VDKDWSTFTELSDLAGQSDFPLPVSIQTATWSLLWLRRCSGCTACHSNSQTDL